MVRVAVTLYSYSRALNCANFHKNPYILPLGPSFFLGQYPSRLGGRNKVFLELSVRLCQLSLSRIQVAAREGIAGYRSPKSLRRPFNVATRLFLNNRLRVCGVGKSGETLAPST